MKDTLFTRPADAQFRFDEQVAAVFDDMLDRSVPFYREVEELCTGYLLSWLKEGGVAADLGCSTGTLLIHLAKKAPFPLELLGIDSSAPMLENARKKAAAYGVHVTFEEGDMTDAPLPPLDAAVTNYTLQFIRPPVRGEAVKRIYDALKPGGLFLFSEKVLSEDPVINKLMIDRYYDYKRQKGYSDFEIAQKREALENVLVPYTVRENEAMVKEAGFTHFETIFRWNNFATFLALKR